jgi:hypothetical protein
LWCLAGGKSAEIKGIRGTEKILEQYEECSIQWSEEEDNAGDVSILAKLDKEEADSLQLNARLLTWA